MFFFNFFLSTAIHSTVKLLFIWEEKGLGIDPNQFRTHTMYEADLVQYHYATPHV